MELLDPKVQPIRTRTVVLKAVIGLEVFGALGGFAGGLPFLIDPSGKMIGMSSAVLESTPIRDFFLVGLWLAGIFGFGGLLVSYTIWTLRSYASSLTYLLAACTAFWVIVENIVFGPSLGLGLAELIFCGPQLASGGMIFFSKPKIFNANLGIGR